MATGSSVYLYSNGSLRALDGPVVAPSWTGFAQRCGASPLTYEAIYRTQPNVRTVVSFLAMNVAQIALHVYQRVGETDRQRLRTHPLTSLLSDPWPGVTQYRLMEALVSDLAIYGQAFWLKVAQPDDRPGLLRIPPTLLVDIEYDVDRVVPLTFRFARAGHPELVVPADAVVWFANYNPTDVYGISPLESLALLLSEDYEAASYRAQLWHNGARIGGVLRRPPEAPDWNEQTRERFRAEWQAWYTGADGAQAGGTPILEDGMEFISGGFTAEQAQYLDARKLTMVQVAAAYHVPPPMVGVLDNANFSNVREFHRSLYQDTLGPWLRMIEQEIGAAVLPEMPPRDGVYVEFNVQEKLRGSFEEQSDALYRSVGAPWMTRAEARARMNLPEREDAQGLIVPLNTAVADSPSQVPPPEPGAAAYRPNGHKAHASA